MLILHSWLRWIVLTFLIIVTIRSFWAWKKKFTYTALDNTFRHITATTAHIQLVLGLYLYFTSPLVAYFWANFNSAVHLREIRFFGMEHITVMLISVVLISIGSMKAKRKTNDYDKFKTQFKYFGIALILILSSIPWEFSPLISRPLFRFS